MANTELETLTITLNAEVGNARKNLNSVATSIKKLEQAGKEADWSVFAKIKEHLQGIANIDFTNVANSLHDVVSAFKALGITRKEMLKIDSEKLTPTLEKPEISTTITEPDFVLPDLKEISFEITDLKDKFIEFDTTARTLKELIDPLEGIKNKLNSVGLSAEQTSIVMKDLGLVSETQTEAKSRMLKETLEELGFTGKSLTAELAKIGSSTKDVGKQAEKSTPKWKKMLNQIKRITFYRAIRRAIQLIVQAFKEGIQNIAQFDNEFNNSMSEIMSSLKYLKNALGASIAPVVEMLTPLITFLTDNIADLANELGAIFSAIQGKDTFVKAKKNAQDYAESLKKVKNASLGIDELNVLQAEDNAEMFETTTIGEEEKTIGQTLKILFDDIKGIITEIFSIVKEITERIPIVEFVEHIVNLIDKLKPIIDVILDLVDLLFDRTEEGVNNSINALLDAVGQIVEFVAGIVKMLSPILNIIIEIASFIINIVNMLLSGIFNSIAMVFETINQILEPLFVILEEILQPIFEYAEIIFDLFEGIFGELIEWGNDMLKDQLGIIGQICGSLNNVLVPILKVVGTLLKAIFSVIEYIIVGVAYAIQAVVNLAKSIVDVLTFNWGNLGNDWSWDLPNQILAKVKATASFATGGFPEDGLFFANHNELVGQFSNGKTAVANNEQITTGIYEAVLQAMQDSGSFGGSNGDVVVQIDGREVARAVNKENEKKGANLFGGVKYAN